MGTFYFRLFYIFLLMAMFGSSPNVFGGQKQPEKRVTFYTTYGYQQGGQWKIPLRIRVVEELNILSRVTSKGIREVIQQKAGLEELTKPQKDIYKERAAGFLEDNESKEVVTFRFDNDPEAEVFVLQENGDAIKSDRNGNIEGELVISKQRAQQLLNAQESKNGWLSIKTIADDQAGAGRIRLIEPKGLSVISDIDDTIKVTEIPSGSAVVLNNTFFKLFNAAPGMSQRYKNLGETTSFHYISGGPWQLYSPLLQFVNSKSTGFPEGSFHMKNVRTNPFESESYEDITRLISSGSKQVTFSQKVSQISLLLTRFPERQFILVGDSGELDPEVYRYVKSKFPEQIKDIQIRDLVNDIQCRPSRLKDMTVIEVEGANQLVCEKQLAH